MNPYTYIRIFAWIAIVALACSVFTEFWIPMIVGAAVVAILFRVALPYR